MQGKICKILMLCILAVLILRLGYVNSNSKKSVFIQEEMNKSSAAMEVEYDLDYLVKVENNIVRNKNKYAAINQEQNNYMEMYPEMYVESIKPIIPIKEIKTAYLSFDDGPSRITCDILNILDKYEVKATFFILGCSITKEGEECLKAMVENGHTIGIHTYSHNPKEIYASVDAFLEDFYKAYQLIYDITGVKVNIFRFPWGSYNTYNKNIRDELVAEMERRGFTFYDWNVSAEDSVGNPSEYRIKQNILKDLGRFKKPVILMHDSAINRLTAKTLPDILENIIEKGYDFDTLDKREPYQFGKK